MHSLVHATASPHARSGHCGEVQGYVRHRPEEGVLYGVVRHELESFLARARAQGSGLPRFVEREFREFLRCGILAHGFARVHCDACGFDRVVAFSCKGRGFCPSCGGRRMADTAAHLVDRVIPEVPVRQWVLSLPFALRYRLAYDSQFTTAVLQVFVSTVFASLRRRARVQWDLAQVQCGSVSFVQRFGDALRLNIHFHSLLLDGVYAPGLSGAPRFYPLPPPGDVEISRVVHAVAKRIARLLERRGLGAEADSSEADPLAESEPLLAAISGASVAGRIATGRRRGQRLLRVGDRIDVEALPALAGERCASVAGLSLHADVAVPARDRRRLERLCRYAGRPPVASERLTRLEDGRLLYRLKQRWRDGTTHVVFEPAELIEKLAALVPPPRFHLVRYHGILGPCASERDRIVPIVSGSCASAARSELAPEPIPAQRASTDTYRRSSHEPIAATAEEPSARVVLCTTSIAPVDEGAPSTQNPALRARRLTWAQLLRRVFAIDVLECPRCGGRLRLLAAIHSPDAQTAMLDCLGLPPRAPPLVPAVENSIDADFEDQRDRAATPDIEPDFDVGA